MLTLTVLRHHNDDLIPSYGRNPEPDAVAGDLADAIAATAFEVFPSDTGEPVATVSRGTVVVEPEVLAHLFAAARVGLEGSEEPISGLAWDLLNAIDGNLDLSADDTVSA